MQAATAFPVGEQLPRATVAAAGHFWKAFAASLLLHAALLAYLGYSESIIPPASAGDDALEIELVVADSEKQMEFDPKAVPETPDVVQSLMASVETPATDVKREVRKEDQDRAMAEALPDIPPVPEPVMFDAEKRETTAASAPPVAVSSPRQAQIKASFAAAIARHLSRYKRFPPRVRHETNQARVVITFEIGANGTVQMARLDKSSGSNAIDAEAIAMIWRAVPFPQPKDALQEKTQFTIPVTYKVR